MARVLTPHLIPQGRCTEGPNGIEFVEEYHVVELSGGRFSMAEALVAEGLPAYGDAVDTPLGVLYCNYRDPKPFAGNSRHEAKVTVKWGAMENDPQNGPIVRFIAATKGVKTNYDRKGELIKAKYKRPGSNIEVEQIAEVTDTKACGVLVADWLEIDNPERKLIPFINCLNNRPYRGGNKFCWWVRAIEIEKQRAKAGFRCHAEVEYDPESFLKPAVYRDANGFIPKDVDPFDPQKTSGNGWVVPEIKGIMDLRLLPFPEVT